jgi:hypothetical protein
MITRVRAQHPTTKVTFVLGAIGILGLGLSGCSKPSVDGPTWSLTGSRAVAPPVPRDATPPMPVYRGGRDPLTGHANVDATPLSPSVAQQSGAAAMGQSSGAVNKPTGVTMAALPPPTSPVTKTPDGRLIVTVQPGETLTAIAATHRVSISGLMFTNNLRNPSVTPGQKLVLPPR